MKIEFVTLAGKSCVHDVDESMTVAALKEELYRPLGIDPLDDLKLFEGTSELLDTHAVDRMGAGPFQVIAQSSPIRARGFLSKYYKSNPDRDVGPITFPIVQEAAKAASRLHAHYGRDEFVQYVKRLPVELVAATLPLWEGWPTGPELGHGSPALDLKLLYLHFENLDFPGSLSTEHVLSSFRCLWRCWSPREVCKKLLGDRHRLPLHQIIVMKTFFDHAIFHVERLIEAEEDDATRRTLSQTISSLLKLSVRLPPFLGLAAEGHMDNLTSLFCEENYTNPAERRSAAVSMVMILAAKLELMEAMSVGARDPKHRAAMTSMVEDARNQLAQHFHMNDDQWQPLESFEATAHLRDAGEDEAMVPEVQDEPQDVEVAQMETMSQVDAPAEPEESDPLADEQDQAHLSKAIMLSKADMPRELSADKVVLCRFDRSVRSPEVQAAFMESGELRVCRRNVLEAGCKLQPEWANGAWILIPLTKDVFEESKLVLTNKDIVMLKDDKPLVRNTLKAIPGSRCKRPRLQPVLPSERLPEAMDGADLASASLLPGGSSSSGAHAIGQSADDAEGAAPSGQRKRVSDDGPQVVERRTFYELTDGMSRLTVSSGESCRSAP